MPGLLTYPRRSFVCGKGRTPVSVTNAFKVPRMVSRVPKLRDAWRVRACGTFSLRLYVRARAQHVIVNVHQSVRVHVTVQHERVHMSVCEVMRAHVQRCMCLCACVHA